MQRTNLEEYLATYGHGRRLTILDSAASRVATCASVLVVIGLIGLALLVNVDNTSISTGSLVHTASLLNVIGPADGTVIECYVKTGDKISVGQILYVIEVDHIANDRNAPPSSNDPAQTKYKAGAKMRHPDSILEESRTPVDHPTRTFVLAENNAVAAQIFVAAGRKVKEGERLAELLPNTTLMGQMTVTEQRVSYLQPLQLVTLKMENHRHETFGKLSGRIVRISGLPTATREALSSGQEEGKTFEVTIAIDRSSVLFGGHETELRAGMEFEGITSGPRQSLWRWLFPSPKKERT